MSIYLNTCSDDSKYLVIYDDEAVVNNISENTNDNDGSNNIINHDSENYNPKRIKLDHFAFIEKLK